MSQYVGLLGYPLSHSISPVFQQAAFDHYGMSVRYDLWPTPPEALESEVSKLRLSRYLGANVTVPHKERIRSLVDEVDSHARSMGAINTIVARDDRLIGYNTDGYGFIRSLQETGGCDPKREEGVAPGRGRRRESCGVLPDRGGRRLGRHREPDGRSRRVSCARRGRSRQQRGGDPRGRRAPEGGGVRLRADRQLHLGRYAARRRRGSLAAGRRSHSTGLPGV